MMRPVRAFYEMTSVGGFAVAAASPTIRARLTPKVSPAQIRSALPPAERTFPESVGMSQRCHVWTSTITCSAQLL
jgi:hypothetical protein